jgi:hypothetical protein
MKKTIAVLAAALVPVLGVFAPATADTISLPYGGTATLTIPDVTLTPGGGCVNHYGTFSTTHVDYWNIDITANGPTTWPATDYLYGTGPQSRVVDLLLCPSFDSAGTYTASGLMTVEDPNSVNQQEVLISDQFVISNPAPPPPPPAPAPAPLPVQNVEGSKPIVKKSAARGKFRVTLKTLATAAGYQTGAAFKWTVVINGKVVKKVVQGAGETESWASKKLPVGKTHKLVIKGNGEVRYKGKLTPQ